MTSSSTSKILVFFIMTFVIGLLINEIQHFYRLFENLYLAQLAPGIVGILLLIYYEVPGTFQTFFVKRVVPVEKPKLILILVSLLPLIIVPLAYFIYKISYNPDVEISKIEHSYLLWPIIGVFFEEFGWRGYFQHRASSFIHMLLSILLTGSMWFLVQIDLYIHDPFFGVISLILYLSINVILSYLFFLNNRNIILCYVFRLTQTLVSIILIFQFMNDIDFMFIITPLYLIAAVTIILLNKKLFQIDTNDIL